MVTGQPIKKTIVNGLVVLFLVGALLSAPAPAYHMFFPKVSTEVAAAQMDYDSAVKERKRLNLILRNADYDFIDGKLSEATFLAIKKNTTPVYRTQRAITSEKLQVLNTLKASERVGGFINTRQYLIASGTIFQSFTMAVILLFVALLLSKQQPFVRYAFIAIGVTYVAATAFFLIWLKMPSDFVIDQYYGYMILVALLFSFALLMLFKKVNNNFKKLQFIHQKLPLLKRDVDLVSDISTIMPEDKEAVSFKAIIDVTGEDLQKNVNEIKKALTSDDR